MHECMHRVSRRKTHELDRACETSSSARSTLVGSASNLSWRTVRWCQRIAAPPNKECEHAWDDQPERMAQARSRHRVDKVDGQQRARGEDGHMHLVALVKGLSTERERTAVLCAHLKMMNRCTFAF